MVLFPTPEAKSSAQPKASVAPLSMRARRDLPCRCKSLVMAAGRVGERCRYDNRCRPNGPEVNPRGQGLCGYGSAARRMPAFEARDAGGVTPRNLR